MIEVLIAGFIGVCVGSALANIAWCWPDHLRELSSRRSVCDHCNAKLGVIDLLPVLGWFIRHGRCAYCATPISTYYWPIELMAGVLAGVAVAWLGPMDGAIVAFAGWLLLLMARIDHDQLILPDVFTLSLTAIGLLGAWLPFWPGPEPLNAIIGGFAGYGMLFVIRWGYFQLKQREGLGLGDVKLFAAAGVWCGWEGLPNIMVLAALTSLLIAVFNGQRLNSATPLPFGPSLAAAMWLQLLWSWPLR